MSKPVILTGLRANNDLHIGNYLGAVLPIVDMSRHKADEYQINLFVPDLHSFTTQIDHSKLYDQIIKTVRFYITAGFNIAHDNVHIYRQSFIPAHSELTVILNSFTGFGEMNRMTQFKDKSENFSIDRISVGLFDYPVLMAADILLHGATYIPVGDDQTQHLEFTRDIAERMNNKFGNMFVVPKPAKEQHEFFGKDQGLRIRDLSDPTKKMSKSDETGKGVIYLADSPEIAQKKIMSATTDTFESIQYDYQKQPGVSNLLDILKLFGGNSDDFIGQHQYGPLKTAVSDVVGAFLADFHKKLESVTASDALEQLEAGEAHVSVQAQEALLRVQKAVGIRK